MSRMVFRSAKPSDLEDIHQLAQGSGITTLPKDLELLKKRLLWSTESFKKSVTLPKHEYYLFVLEDTKSAKVVGTSAIESAVGYDTPFYSYKLSKRTRISHSQHIQSHYEVLSLVNDYQGNSELCTLFLDPTYRHHGNGVLLSRARFLFIAEHPMRFSPTIIAEMRGISDDEGHAPFWDQVGHHFFHMSFAKADSLTLSTNKQFIADLMPRNPLYVKLLAPEAQAVIGKPHATTLPAMKILLQEGFRYDHYVDIFDAGPTVEAPRDTIQTILKSRVLTVKTITDDVSSQRFILATTKPSVRATIGPLLFNEQEKSCILNHETAEMLNVALGDSIRVAPLRLGNTL